MPLPAIDLAALLDRRRVLVLPGRPGKRDALLALADTITVDFTPEARLRFIKSLFDREEVASTACGCGVAIPHARVPGLPGCRIAVGLCPDGVEFVARDGSLVRVLVLLASREEDHPEHLRVLATLAARLRQPTLAGNLCATALTNDLEGALRLLAG